VDHAQHSCYAMGCQQLPGIEGPTVGSKISETREPSTVGSGASIAIPATVLYSRLRAITIHLAHAREITQEGLKSYLLVAPLDSWSILIGASSIDLHAAIPDAVLRAVWPHVQEYLSQRDDHLNQVLDQLLGLLQDYQDAAFLAELGAQQTQTIKDRLVELRTWPDQ